ncbi:MAG: hypothetical protein ACLQUY_12690 [Ktedonobacterales bacterium]
MSTTMDDGLGCLVWVIIGMLLFVLGYAIGTALQTASGDLNTYGVVLMAIGAFIVIVALLVSALRSFRSS